MNARESENYLAISRSSSASTSVVILWAEIYRGIKYNIFGFILKTSYVTQTLNIKYLGTIEPRATLDYLATFVVSKMASSVFV